MYAIIESGGKQHRAEIGRPLRVEKLEAKVGDNVSFDRVLLVNRDGEVSLGKPFVDGATVSGRVIEQGRAPKVRVFKMKRRKQYRRTRGHRQAFTAVRIESID